MNKIILGKYVNTHGIKGEIRIKSFFKYKDRVFKIGNKIIIDNKEYIINSYRVHKGFDMVTLVGIDDINNIPFSKNIMVYINRDDYLFENDYLDSDLIGFLVYNKSLEARVTNILYINEKKKILECGDKLIPFELIINVDLSKKEIQIMEVDGL